MAGELCGGRYRVIEPLGSGAQGDVFRARDEITGTDVALKLARARASSDLRARVLVEGVALRMLRLPGVVPVLDEGEHDGRSFLVTRLVDGAPFPGRSSHADRRDLVAISARLLDVLDEIHGAGIAHGDLKPANVLVDAAGAPWVLDFGVALPLTPRSALGDCRDDAGGTPAYVAPERIRGRPASPAADLYSVGVMLYQAWAGCLPHGGTHAPQIMFSRLTQAPRPLGEVALDAPEHVALAIDALLRSEPSERPRSAAVARSMMVGAAATSATATVAALGAHGRPLTARELEALFQGDERLLHAKSDAATALLRRTSGNRARVVLEMDRWCRLGIVHDSGAAYRIERESLDALEVMEDASIDVTLPASELAEKARVAAHRARSTGRVGLAAAYLDDAARALRQRDGEVRADGASDVFTSWLELVASEQSPRGAGKLRYELEKHRAPFVGRAAIDALASAVVDMSADPLRALVRLEALGTLECRRLEVCRAGLRMISSRSGSLEDERRVLEDVAAGARGTADPQLLARLDGWRGRVAYRAGRYREAAELHLVSARGLTRPLDAVAARLNAAAALLEDAAPDEVIEVVRRAREGLADLRAPLLEARAEWLTRTARYRRGDPLAPDLELVESSTLLGVPHVEAQIAFTEAAIAWRCGAADSAHALAERAELGWRGTRTHVEFAWLARALRAAAAGMCDDANEIAIAACESVSPGAGIQTLGLLAIAGCALPPRARADAERLARTVPSDRAAARLDILSVDEARRAITRAES